MIVMMVVVLSGCRRDGRGPGWRIRLSPGGARRRFRRGRILKGNATGCTKAVLRTVQRSAHLASATLRLRSSRSTGHGGVFSVHLEGKPLDGLQCSRNALLPRLGMTHVVAQPSEELVDCGVLREFPLGCIRGRRVGWSWCFVLIHGYLIAPILVENACYRLENSIFPSASVGTPLHMAGR